MTDPGRISISHEMLPQPPPNAEAPLPSEAALLSRRKWRWLLGVGIFSVLVVLVLLTPFFIRKPNYGPKIEAEWNAKRIELALFEFESEYGKFPDTTTISAVQSKTGTLLPLGTKSSNDFFRQLIASEIVQSEQIFYAKTAGSHKPDGIVTATEALKAGECGFTYFLGATAKDNPRRPIVVTPMIPGTARFDPYIHNGKAVILKLDLSVTTFNIDKDGHVIVDGRNLMDPRHPIWDGHAPVIAWPE